MPTIVEAHTDCGAIQAVDGRNFRIGFQLHAKLLGTGSHGLGDRAHAAAHIAPDTTRAAGTAHHVVQQHIAGPRRRGRQISTDDRVGGQGGAQDGRFEPALQNRPRRAEQQFHGGRQFVAQPGQLPAQLPGAQQISELLQPAPTGARQHIQRRLLHQRLQHFGHPGEPGFVTRPGGGVGGRELADLLLIALWVCAEDQSPAIWPGRERGWLTGQHLVAVLGQPQILDDLRVQQTDHVGSSRRSKARRQFLGDAGAADHTASLKQPHALAGRR